MSASPPRGAKGDMDLTEFARHFSAATNVPLALLHEGRVAYSSLSDILGVHVVDQPYTLYPPSRNPEFNSISSDIEYGHVHVEGTSDDIYIGPIFTVPLTDRVVEAFMAESGVPPEHRERLEELLLQVPVTSRPGFLRVLAFLHLYLNGEQMQVDELYGESSERARARAKAAQTMVITEDMQVADAVDFEERLFDLIRSGDYETLRAFLQTAPVFPEGGRVAATPLRQVKNAFTSLVSRATARGAVPGGLDRIRARQLADQYIRECEQLQSIDDVRRLRFVMLMDLCGRVSRANIPADIRPEIREAMTYIRANYEHTPTLQEVSDYIHRSPSHLMRHFKGETGMSVGTYITECKVDAAKRLLSLTSLPLGTISAQLGFSSQSYFQNVFKKHTGTTPRRYRQNHQEFL